MNLCNFCDIQTIQHLYTLLGTTIITFYSLSSLFLVCVNDPLNIYEDTHFHRLHMIVFACGQSTS